MNSDNKDGAVYLPHIDILRVVACALVIVNHTNSRLFMGMPPVYPVWFFSAGMFFISKTAVPIFIMISGALLLGRDESYKKTLGRAGRIAAVTLIFSAFYFICDQKEAFTLTSVGEFFRTVYSDVQTRAFWYLYLYIGLLLMLPLLRKLVRGMVFRDYLYMLGMTFVIVSVLPAFFDKTTLPYYNSSIITPLFNGYLGYFIAGYFIERVSKRRTREGFFIALTVFCVSVLFSVAATYFEFAANPSAYPYWDNRLAFNVALPAVSLYYMATYIKPDALSARASAFIKKLGSLTFGTYLISDMLIFRFEPIFEVSAAYLPDIVTVALVEFAVLLMGMIFTAYLKKMPVFKRLL